MNEEKKYRLGNIVIYNNEIHELDGVLIDSCSIKGYGFIEWDYVNAVDLTFELLQKMGLIIKGAVRAEQTKKKSVFYLSTICPIKGSKRIIILFNPIAEALTLSNKTEAQKNIINDHIVKIEHAHQLQNIDFDLFGNELTYNP